jgi:hypothetical protein
MSQMSVNNNPQDKESCYFFNQQDGETVLPKQNKKGEIFEQELTGIDSEEVFLTVKETREALQVKDSEQVLLAVAFVCDDKCRRFECFPEVTFWDKALKTNREKHPLFLACGKDSENQTFTYLCAFMPSECLWVFDWLYTRGMTQLMGKQVLQWTNLSLTDGDKNKYDPLEAQIQNGTFGMSHVTCGFHLVDRSMVTNPFGKSGLKKEEDFLSVKRHLKN